MSEAETITMVIVREFMGRAFGDFFETTGTACLPTWVRVPVLLTLTVQGTSNQSREKLVSLVPHSPYRYRRFSKYTFREEKNATRRCRGRRVSGTMSRFPCWQG